MGNQIVKDRRCVSPFNCSSEHPAQMVVPEQDFAASAARLWFRSP